MDTYEGFRGFLRKTPPEAKNKDLYRRLSKRSIEILALLHRRFPTLTPTTACFDSGQGDGSILLISWQAENLYIEGEFLGDEKLEWFSQDLKTKALWEHVQDPDDPTENWTLSPRVFAHIGTFLSPNQ